jgi:hypothetical protein
VLPDEEFVIIPQRWWPKVHPRRGGGVVPEITVPDDAVEKYREFLRQAWRPEWFDRLPRGDEVYYPAPPARLVPELFEPGRSFAREWLGAAPTPGGSALGAAVVALTTCNSRGWQSGAALTVSAWMATGGCEFAARALMELAGIVWLPGAGTRSLLTIVTEPGEWEEVNHWYDENRRAGEPGPRKSSADEDDARVLAGIAQQLRRYAAVASDEDYRQLVAVLGEARHGFPQRLVASYVTPTVIEWVDQDCADLVAWITQRWKERRTELDDGRELADVVPTVVQRLLFFAASTVRHLEQLLPVQGASFDREEVIATILDGVGPAGVGLLVSADGFGEQLYLCNRFWGGDITDEGVELLRELATDDAFRLLAQATLRPPRYQKKSRVAEMVTAPVFLRCPVRALRLLAERAEGGDPIDLDVLALRVFHDVAVAEQALPLLPAPAQARVAALLAGDQTGVGQGLRSHLKRYDGLAAADRKRMLTLTAQLPLPDALRLLLDDIDGKYVRQALLAEGRRKPERMVRMLAEQAQAGHPAAEEVLRGQVLAYPKAAEAAMKQLEPGARERVGAILAAARPRADAAGPELVPAVLQSPAGKSTRAAALPTWVVVPALPPVWLRGGDHTLPPAAVHRLCGLFAKAKPAAVPDQAAPVLQAADPQSLATFAWALFEQWQTAKYPGDQLALTVLAAFGDDTTVARLARLLPEWSRTATWLFRPGLDALAGIGSDAALTHLQRLARRAETKASRRQAEDRMTRIAQTRGLSEMELADRIVPDFGLSADGRMTVDYGPRRFVASFDAWLQPVITGPDGKRLKRLPKPGVADDAALAGPAYEAFRQLSKDVLIVAKERIKALEVSMVEQSPRRAGDFRAFLADHPLMGHLARKLVWVTAAGVSFRVAEDRTLADLADELLTVDDDEVIRLAHPLLLGEERARWAEVFEDYEILQPFAQLHREVFRPGPPGFGAVVGAQVDGRRLAGLRSRGWLVGSESDLRRPCPGGLVVVLTYSPDLGDEWSQPRLMERAEVRRLAGDTSVPADLGELPPIWASEALRDVHSLTA